MNAITIVLSLILATASAAANNPAKAYLLGGFDAGLNSTATISIFDGFTWKASSSMALPAPRSLHQSLSFQGQLVVLGGYHGSVDNVGNSTNTALSYSFNKWASLPSMTVARAQFAAVVYADKIFVLGGYSESGIATASVEMFNGQSWLAGPSLPQALAAGAAAVFRDDLYHVGGTPARQGVSPVSDVYRLDGPAWVKMTAMSCGRSSHSLAVFQNSLYALAGFSDSGYNRSITAERYNGKTWSPCDKLTVPRSSAAAWVQQGYLQFAGGRQSTRADSATNSLEWFDGVHWHQGTQLLAPVYGAAATVF